MLIKTLNGIKYLFCEVPEGAKCRLAGLRLIVQKRFAYETYGLKHYHEDAFSIYIHEHGNWQLLGKADEIREKVAAVMMERFAHLSVKPWLDYEFPDSRCYSATESLRTLIASLNLDFSRTVILKEI